MKIFSKDKSSSSGILIPTRMYEIAIETDGYGLNLLERTIKELLEIKPNMEIKEIKTILGLTSIENMDNLISLVVEKLGNTHNQDKKVENQINIFQFYQELYGGEILPFVSARKDEYKYITNSIVDNGNFVKFELHGKDNKAFYKKPKNIKINPPTPQSIIRAINKHNQNSTDKINITSLKLENPPNYSIIYLYTDILFDKNNRFNIKSPFNDSFSPILNIIFARHCKDLVNELRSKDYIHKYMQIEQDKIIFGNELDDIRHNILSYFSSDNKKETYLFVAYEKLFERIIKEKKLTILNGNMKPKEICQIAKNIKLNCDDSLKIFDVNNAKNLQLLLATILNGDSQIFKEIARNYPDFLINLDRLLIVRNTQNHGGEQKISVDKKELDELFIIFKSLFSNVTSPKERDIITSMPQEHKYNDNNGYIDMEEELGDILSYFSEDDIDDLSEIYEINDFDVVNVEVFSKIVGNLYKVIERNLKNIIKPSLPIDGINTKNIKLGKNLKNTREKFIKKALKGQNASLGAYMLVYISIQEVAQTDVDFIDKLLGMREHGDYSINHINAYLPQDLKDIKSQGIKFIEKILTKEIR